MEQWTEKVAWRLAKQHLGDVRGSSNRATEGPFPGGHYQVSCEHRIVHVRFGRARPSSSGKAGAISLSENTTSVAS